MKLFDFFLVHAPAEPQHWFKPVIAPEMTQESIIKRFRGEHGFSDFKHDDNFLDVWIVKWDRETRIQMIAPNRKCGHVDVPHEFREEVERAFTHEAEERLKQWPAAWAAMMIEKRKMYDSTIVDYAEPNQPSTPV